MAMSSFDLESVLYDITPEKPTNPSYPDIPCVVIHLRYSSRWQAKFQSDGGGGGLMEDPELRFLFSIPLDTFSSDVGDSIFSHMLEERTDMILESCEREYLRAQVCDFAALLLLEKSNMGHQQGIEMVAMLYSTQVVCTDNKFFLESYEHDETTAQKEEEEEEEEEEDLMEVVADNFDLFVSV